ncbi:cyclin-dependent kinase, partial [Metarhizium majus ARSEF 297]
MSSPWKKQPEDVVDSVLKRAEVSKIARRLQNRLALAQFKTKHGWEDLTLDSIEPKLEEEMRRRRLCDGDVLSDSSSSASDLPYPTKALMSSPLKAPLFSDAIGSSNGSSGHRKRTYFASFDHTASSPSKRFRTSPTAHKSFSGHSTWKDSHELAQSSPIKPRRQQHFTTSGGPDVSFFQQRRMTDALTSPNFAAPSDDDDDLLPAHSFTVNNVRSSPPRTPPLQTRGLASKRSKETLDAGNGGKTGEEGADLLLYLAASPSPAVKSNRGRMERLSTPPPKNSKLDLPSSMMTTPGGGNLFPNTPGQGFDFADFVNITPSPAQKPWRTPGPMSARTPLSVTRRRLTFEEPLA